MEETIKYARKRGYCYDNRRLFSELRTLLLKQEKPVISKEMTTIKLRRIVEEINKAMADYFVEHQELDIPYIGRLNAVERERYYNPATKRTNLPVMWNETRRLKLANKLPKGGAIYNINVLRLVRIRFNHKKHQQAAFFKFRTCQNVATRLINYVTDNSIAIFKEKRYDKRD